MGKRRKKNRRNRRRLDQYRHIEHIDYPWIQEKIDGHGGSCCYKTRNSLTRIGYIGSTNWFKVEYYNLILFFKYLKRKLRS